MSNGDEMRIVFVLLHCSDIGVFPAVTEYEAEFGFFPPVKLIEGSLPFPRPYPRTISDRIESAHFSPMNEVCELTGYLPWNSSTEILEDRS